MAPTATVRIEAQAAPDPGVSCGPGRATCHVADRSSVGWASGRGLEIGPLSRPVALRSACDVRYVDIFSAEVLRSRYAADPDVVDDDDPATSTSPCTTPTACCARLRDVSARDAPYRWVAGLARHRARAGPDRVALGRRGRCSRTAAPSCSPVPDRRYTFDARRPQTTVGQIARRARERRRRDPPSRAVYDHFRSVVSVPAADAVGRPGRRPTTTGCTGRDVVADAARADGRAATTSTRTSGCSRPQTFAEQVAELARLGVVDFVATPITGDAARTSSSSTRDCERMPRDMSDADGQRSPRAARSPRPGRRGADLGPRRHPHAYVSAKELRLIRAKRRLFEALRPRSPGLSPDRRVTRSARRPPGSCAGTRTSGRRRSGRAGARSRAWRRARGSGPSRGR